MGRQRSIYGIRAQWRDLSTPTDDESLVEQMVRLPSAAIRSVSPYRYILGRSWLPGSLPGDVYVLGWWLVLILAAVAFSYVQVVWLAVLVLAVAAARFADILATQLGVIIVDHKRDGHYFQSIERSVLLAFNNVGQIIVCLGLLASAVSAMAPGLLVFATDCHNAVSRTCAGIAHPTTVIDYVYMASGQVLTVGSKYSPVTAGAELFHMIAVSTGLLLIALSIAFFVGGITSEPPIRVQSLDDQSPESM